MMAKIHRKSRIQKIKQNKLLPLLFIFIGIFISIGFIAFSNYLNQNKILNNTEAASRQNSSSECKKMGGCWTYNKGFKCIKHNLLLESKVKRCCNSSLVDTKLVPSGCINKPRASTGTSQTSVTSSDWKMCPDPENVKPLLAKYYEYIDIAKIKQIWVDNHQVVVNSGKPNTIGYVKDENGNGTPDAGESIFGYKKQCKAGNPAIGFTLFLYSKDGNSVKNK